MVLRGVLAIEGDKRSSGKFALTENEVSSRDYYMRRYGLVNKDGLSIQPLNLLVVYFAAARIPILIEILEPVGRQSFGNFVADVLHYDDAGTVVVPKVILIGKSVLHLCVEGDPPVALQIEIAPYMIFSNGPDADVMARGDALVA